MENDDGNERDHCGVNSRYCLTDYDTSYGMLNNTQNKAVVTCFV